jgi:hypothetical protein
LMGGCKTAGAHASSNVQHQSSSSWYHPPGA